jgi:hypothetical protein
MFPAKVDRQMVGGGVGGGGSGGGGIVFGGGLVYKYAPIFCRDCFRQNKKRVEGNAQKS